jgi:hypothetical protein
MDEARVAGLGSLEAVEREEKLTRPTVEEIVLEQGETPRIESEKRTLAMHVVSRLPAKIVERYVSAHASVWALTHVIL